MNKSTSLSSARLEGESFEEFKARQKAVNKATKRYLKGNVVWVSKKLRRDTIGRPILRYDGKEDWIGNTFKRGKDEKRKVV